MYLPNTREWINSLKRTPTHRHQTLRVGLTRFWLLHHISRGMADKAPEEYIRKQTLVNSERITPELKEYESLVLNAETQIHEIELKVFNQVARN